MTWYTIRAKAQSAAAQAAAGSASASAKHAEVFIYGDIGESWWGETVAANTFVREFAAIDADTITVRIASHGGSVTDGIAIHNAIKRHRATVTTIVDSIAASIASLIYMAGDEREIADNAMLMIHAPWTYGGGNSAQLREQADLLDQFATAMSSTYAAATGKPAEEMLALLTDGADHWYTAGQAVDAGFSTRVTAALPIAASASLTKPRFTVPAAAAAFFKPQESTMTQQATTAPAAAASDEINAKAPAAPQLDAAAITAAAVKAEASRRDAIEASFKPHAALEGAAELLQACLRDTQCAEDAANKKLLALMAKGAAPAGGHGNITVAKDERDKRIDAMTQSIIARAGTDPQVKADSANPFRGYKLLDLARASLEKSGISTAGMDQMRIVAQAFTQGTGDFPVLLENVMHKTLLSAYATQNLTWNRFCATGSVSDFRAHNRYRLGSFGNLDSKTELGEFKSKSIPDGEKAQVSIGTKGNIINLSREAVINDDLGAFVGLAAMLGRAAARTVESDVYALLALNGGLGPVMSDGKTLFHADHGNIAATGSAPSMAAFEAVRVQMALQKDISGNDFLDLRPSIWLGPLGLGGEARVVNGSQYDPDVSGKFQRPNKVVGMFNDIVDTPRLSGTAWIALAPVSEAPVIEVDFLDGNQTPYLEMQNGWSVDGSAWKIRLDYGVTAVDHRGAIRNAGA